MTIASITTNRAADVFWGELSACDHCVQIYEDDQVFMDALERFVAGGIRQGDAIVLIATPPHLSGLAARLTKNGFDVDAAAGRDQYIALDAEEILSKFMVDGWPDEEAFFRVIEETLARARNYHHKVRAFGEMVALMWAAGHCGATVRLEHLWTRLCQKESFSLFCAYPRSGFTQDASSAIEQVCAAHSKLYTM